MAIAAASFIYIATADLMPILHARGRQASALRQLALMVAGIATIVLLQGHR